MENDNEGGNVLAGIIKVIFIILVGVAIIAATWKTLMGMF